MTSQCCFMLMPTSPEDRQRCVCVCVFTDVHPGVCSQDVVSNLLLLLCLHRQLLVTQGGLSPPRMRGMSSIDVSGFSMDLIYEVICS